MVLVLLDNLLQILIFTLRNFTNLPILRYLGVCNVLHKQVLLKNEVGTAGSRSTQTRDNRISTIHPYTCFSRLLCTYQSWLTCLLSAVAAMFRADCCLVVTMVRVYQF